MPGAHCRSDDLSQLRYGLLATSQWDAQPSSMQLLHAAQVQPHAGWPHEHCQSLRAPICFRAACSVAARAMRWATRCTLQVARDKGEGRALLQQHGVAHYWDAAESFAPELAQPVDL